jgi:hypothetical protein
MFQGSGVSAVEVQGSSDAVAGVVGIRVGIQEQREMSMAAPV